MRLGAIPYQLVTAEPLDVLVQNTLSVVNRAFVTFCDGVAAPVKGKIVTARFTATASLLTATWVNSPIVFQTQLPAGDYNLVGGRLVSPNGVYFRFFFKGGMWRPGAPCATVENDNEWPDFRWGNYGVWDKFNNVTPPSVDIVGVTDTAQVGYMDIIKL